MENKKYNNITLLSILCAFAVVQLHTNGVFWTFSKEKYWCVSNIIDGIFSFAVPCFFMITGANLIGYQDRYTTKEYFTKRIKKVFIPFVFWSFISILFVSLIEHSFDLSTIGIRTIINGVLNSKFIPIYWFFITLFCIYLIIPLFSSIDKTKKKKVFMYITIIGFIINALIPFVNNVFSLKIEYSLSISVTSGYIFYVLVGYLLNEYVINKKMRVIIYTLGIVGLILYIVPTYFLSVKANDIIWKYRGNNNVPCIMYSISVFVFIKYLCEIKLIEKVIKFISPLAKYTFSIYLMHWYVMKLLRYNLRLDQFSIYYIIGMPFIIIAICILIAFILKKIPIIRKIVP